jgi:hypothetical protein
MKSSGGGGNCGGSGGSLRKLNEFKYWIVHVVLQFIELYAYSSVFISVAFF